ncbi:DUF2510 domain-containing protein [Cellulomonas sp.]|uniref:DUF2510 domain-containing protein n=1 Tax=Cellulomonas sp. TaxID=40001 RepID=UPI002D6DF599|nr:DUF2510 domain-containing protein [Cellulomonas sp.]HYQ76460.1 DUF2510 domain-containing protein [Cellulomonas sp.]
MTEAQPLPPAGWYPDGVTPAVLRWFDGAAWTEHTAPDPAAQAAAPAPAPVPAASPLPAGPVPDAPVHRPPGAHAARSAGAPAHARHPTAAGAAVAGGPYAAQPVPALAGVGVAGAHAGPAYAAAGPHASGPGYAAAPGTVWYPEPARLGADPRDPVHWLLPTGRSWQSIVAGYVGLLALLIWPLGPFAVWFGLWALRKGSTGGHGRGRAVFAVVVGAAATGLLAYLLASGALTT